MNVKKPLHILIVEDNPDDADWLLAKLRLAGFDPQWKRVQTEPDFLAEIKKLPDIILSDYLMPEFNGLRAAELLEANRLDIPFILISGIVGEDVAVEAMKHGATDYLLKDRIARLGAAVEQALEQKRLRDEHKRMQEQLVLHATALETAANAVMITNRTGTILWVNPAFTTVTGFLAEEIMGKTPRALKSGKHDERFYQDFWRTITAGKTWRGEFINRRKDGSLYYDEHTVTPVRSEGGAITHFIGIMHDVTERRRAAENIAERAHQATLGAHVGVALTRGGSLREVLQRCAEALVINLGAAFARIWTLNVAGDVLELQASAGMYTHLDGPHGRVPVGKFKIGLIAEERKPHLTNSVIGDPRVSEQEWAKREGLVAFAGHPLLIENHLVGVMALFSRQPLSDATLATLSAMADGIALGIERKRAEEAFHESEAQLRYLSDNLPNGMLYQLRIGKDEQRQFTYVGGAVRSLHGCTPEEAMADAARIYANVHEDDRVRLQREEEKAAATLSIFKTEVRTRSSAGEIRWIELVSRPRKLEDGSLMWDGIEIDITERKRAAEEIQNQLDELQRWHEAMLGREDRVLELKQEVNELLTRQNLSLRYSDTKTP